MPRIHTVAQDGTITAGDKLIGSDGDPNNGYVTRNYTVGGISNFVLGGTNAGSFTTITTTGNGTIGGNLSVTGDLSVTGNATIAGNLTFGDADTDTVSFSADVNSHILPDVTNTYDLGSATKQWRDIYVDGTAYIDHMDLLEVGPHVAVGQGANEPYLIYDNNAVLSRDTDDYGLSIICTPQNNNGNASLILGTSDQMDGVQMGYNVNAYTKEFTINMRGNTFMKFTDSIGPFISIRENTSILTDKNFSAGSGTGTVTFLNAPSIGPSNDRYQLVGGRPSSDNQFLKYTTNGTTEWADIDINGYTFPSAAGTAGQVLKIPSSGTQLEWANDLQSAASAVVGSGTNTVNSAADDFVVNLNSTNGGMTIVTQDGTNAGNGPEFRLATNTQQNAFILDYDDSIDEVRMQRHGGYFLKAKATETQLLNKVRIGTGSDTPNTGGDGFVVNEGQQSGMTILNSGSGTGPGFSRLYFGKSDDDDAFYISYANSSDQFEIRKNGNLIVAINTNGPSNAVMVDIGYLLKLGNVSTFADDTAAGTGGLTTGMVYKKSDGTLMIKS